MRRALPIPALLIILAVFWPAAPAAAGGAVFQFAKEYYSPGDVVEGSTSVWMGRDAMSLLDQGPFEAYLVPSDRWIDPPRIPAGSVHVGTVDFSVTGIKEAIARVSFVVPEVQSATYSISYCNDPCTVADVGDLVGGWFKVAEDDDEAALLAKVSRLEVRNSQKAFRLAELERETRQIDRLRDAVAAAETQASEMQREVVQLAGELRTERERADGGPGVAQLVGAAATGIVAGLVLRGRRRRPAPPDSPIREAERVLERVP
jgi:hypothetical protein